MEFSPELRRPSSLSSQSVDPGAAKLQFLDRFATGPHPRTTYSRSNRAAIASTGLRVGLNQNARDEATTARISPVNSEKRTRIGTVRLCLIASMRSHAIQTLGESNSTSKANIACRTPRRSDRQTIGRRAQREPQRVGNRLNSGGVKASSEDPILNRGSAAWIRGHRNCSGLHSRGGRAVFGAMTARRQD